MGAVGNQKSTFIPGVNLKQNKLEEPQTKDQQPNTPPKTTPSTQIVDAETSTPNPVAPNSSIKNYSTSTDQAKPPMASKDNVSIQQTKPRELKEFPNFIVKYKDSSNEEQFFKYRDMLKEHPEFAHFKQPFEPEATLEYQNNREAYFSKQLQLLRAEVMDIATNRNIFGKSYNPNKRYTKQEIRDYLTNQQKAIMNNVSNAFTQRLSEITTYSTENKLDGYSDNSHAIPEINNIRVNMKSKSIFYKGSEALAGQYGVDSRYIKELTIKNYHMVSELRLTNKLEELNNKYGFIFDTIKDKDGAYDSGELNTLVALLMTKEEIDKSIELKFNNSKPLTSPELSMAAYVNNLNPSKSKTLDYELSRAAGMRLYANILDTISSESGIEYKQLHSPEAIQMINRNIANTFEYSDSNISEEKVLSIVHNALVKTQYQHYSSYAKRCINGSMNYALAAKCRVQAMNETNDAKKRIKTSGEDLIDSNLQYYNIDERDEILGLTYIPKYNFNNKSNPALKSSQYSTKFRQGISTSSNLPIDRINKIYNEERRRIVNMMESPYEYLETNHPKIYNKLFNNGSNRDYKLAVQTMALLRTSERAEEIATKHDRAYKQNGFYLKHTELMFFNNQRILAMNTNELEKEFPGIFNTLRKEGYSNKDIHKVLRNKAEFDSARYRHNYEVSKKFFDIMAEDDKFHNIDAGILNIFYNLANGIGAPFVEDQNLLNEAAILANARGASTILGEWGGNFIRENLLEVGLLVASFIVPSAQIPAAIEEIYGGAKKVAELRSTYHTLKMQGIDDNKIALTLAIQYGEGKVRGRVKGAAIDNTGNVVINSAKSMGLDPHTANKLGKGIKKIGHIIH